MASLDYHLPALAEAAPDTFLEVILHELQRPDTVLLRLFDEEDSIIHRTAHHTGLLWALEGLAWPAQFSSDAALSLAGLDRLDPGGQLSNRPINSLRTIFLGWHPQTTATVSERLAVLDRIRQVYPEVGWRLVQRLLPKHYDHGFNSHLPTFHWRDWQVNPDRKVPMAEYFQFITGLTERLLTDVGTDPQRWTQLIDELPQLLEHLDNDTIRVRVLAQLQQLASLPIPDDGRLNLLKELREFLNHHRSCQDTNWAWREKQLSPIDSLYQQLQPESLLLRHAWIFDQWPCLPEGLEHHHHEENALLIQQRQEEALGELVTTEGQSVIEQLIPLVPNNFELGQVIARSIHFTDDDRIELFQKFAAATDENQDRLSKGLAARFTRILGIDRAAAIVRKQASNWQPQQQAIWLWTLPMNSTTWQLAHELGEEIKSRYWQIANEYVEHDAEALEAVRQFLVHHRPAAAARALNRLKRHDKQRLPIDLVLETLESLLRAHSEAPGHRLIHSYELDTLLDELEYVPDEQRNQAIKLAFLFGRATTLRNPKLLNSELQRNPAFFVELLTALYLPDNSTPADLENLTVEEKQNKTAFGTQAWSILRNWNTFPGMHQDGSFDEEHFGNWVNKARMLATEKGISKGFDIQLGLLISQAPAGSDDVWPHPAVCALLEAESQNDMIARHVHMGCYNRHGRTHIVDGGRREQAIASDYSTWAERIQTKYPATARLLRQLQEDFSRQSHSEKERADREEQFGM